MFVSAEVLHPCLGITTIYLRCEALRDYFYVGSRQRPWGRQSGGPPVRNLVLAARLKSRHAHLGPQDPRSLHSLQHCERNAI